MEERSGLGPNIRGVVVPMVVIAALGFVWLFAREGNQLQTAAASPLPVPDTRIIFNRDIRPILADRCFSCHGPDGNKRQAGLRLDRPASAMGPCPQHPDRRAFVPGDPDHSEALRRILSTDTVTIMPPVASHRELSAKEKDLVRRWLIQGGEYQEHWAFTKPQRPSLPEVRNTSWAKNEIDRFVLANLESQGLEPSPTADRPTLIRRVSLDLTGIPPTTAVVDAFVADTSPSAFEHVVDRLLASPRYGEQMATQWLDYARYADSHGYQSDPERHMWKWRDWVINAYNQNMPFDQFTIEQLAGDLLPNATIDQRIATGFNRNHRINDEGGIIPEEWRVEGVIDRVSTTSAVFMGLTLECCRCHDHKYDPITQKEFYSFSAYFNSVKEQGVGDTATTDRGINVPPILKCPSPDQVQKRNTLAVQLRLAQAELARATKSVSEQTGTIAADDARLREPGGLTLRLPLNNSATVLKTGAADAMARPVNGPTILFTTIDARPAVKFEYTGAAIDAGDAIKLERDKPFSYGAWVRRHGVGGSVLSRMNAADKTFRGFDIYLDGDRPAVHLIHDWDQNALKVQSTVPLVADKWSHVMVTYDGSSKAAGVRIFIDGRATAVAIKNDHLTDTILTGSPLLIGRRDGADPMGGYVSDVRFYDHALTAAEAASVARAGEMAKILAVPTTQRTLEQASAVTAFLTETDPSVTGAAGRVTDLKRESDRVESEVPDTMVMEEAAKPRDTFVLVRGEYDKHGDKVSPGVPAVLPPLPQDAPPNRLGLARWIVDPQNPLTSRVQANRLWEKFFGVGLVKTSENMGTQTEWPSDPELLDWLATEMVRQHWDLKAFQKQIVMSAAYQQRSDMTPEMAERDPENRLIDRGPRFRLSAEQIRDQALYVSGLLVEQTGGPSVKPYQPTGLWAGNLYGNLAKYTVDTGAALYRRSMYTFVKRTAVPANLSLFDQPSREFCVIRRSRTDTPLQALDLMNDATYLEAARALAEHMMRDGGPDPASRIRFAFKRVTCRSPNESEANILLDGFRRRLAHFQSGRDAASKLLTVGNSPPDTTLDPAELAAYTLTASTILNLDETVTRQ